MEHLKGQSWQYRWRLKGDFPSPYLVWRSATIAENRVLIKSEARNAVIECEWRSGPDERWSQAALLSLGLPSAMFSVSAAVDFKSPEEGFIACAPVREDGVGAYHFPAMSLKSGDSVEVAAVADAPAWPNVLLEAGEFQPVIPGLRIVNLTSSAEAVTSVAHDGPFMLEKCPALAVRRRWFAIGRDSVDASLLTPLLS